MEIAPQETEKKINLFGLTDSVSEENAVINPAMKTKNFPNRGTFWASTAHGVNESNPLEINRALSYTTGEFGPSVEMFVGMLLSLSSSNTRCCRTWVVCVSVWRAGFGGFGASFGKGCGLTEVFR